MNPTFKTVLLEHIVLRSSHRANAQKRTQYGISLRLQLTFCGKDKSQFFHTGLHRKPSTHKIAFYWRDKGSDLALEP